MFSEFYAISEFHLIILLQITLQRYKIKLMPTLRCDLRTVFAWPICAKHAGQWTEKSEFSGSLIDNLRRAAERRARDT
jgi:hypothetical protein